MSAQSLTRPLRALACAVPLLLSACGGGGDSPTPAPLDCSVPAQQDWLQRYMNDWYFWYRLSPNPAPGGHATVASYFDALVYGGGDAIPGDPAGARWPADRYSDYQSTESFNRFFGDGQTLGYGVAVAGLEVAGQPSQPLYVRYIEPQSPAAQTAGGPVRGDQVISVNGRPASELIADNDFSVLTPAQSGDRLTLVLRNGAGVERSVTLSAAIFNLTPVQNAQVLVTPNGRSVGYLMVKDMIDQAATPLSSAFANFRANNVRELVLDLRYNGGGLVSTAGMLASYAAGAGGSGQLFARLLYNDKRSGNNQDFIFSNPGAWAGFSKVYVLAGERTCSASEQLINGLRGIGVTVVAVGDTTCGKPVGFLPQSNSCGTTYNVVNFESVNKLNQGRYFDGFAATCAVAEDFSRPIGGVGDPLLVAAAHHADSGACPAGTGLREQLQSRGRAGRTPYRGADGAERSGMAGR